MKRRDFVFASASMAGLLLPVISRAARPCPPPTLNAAGGSSSTTTCPISSGSTFSTNFPNVENPISEGGRWSNITGNRAYVRSAGGYACGTQTGSNGYDDSIAILSGTFNSALTTTGVIHLVNPDLNGDSHEAELLLRFTQSAGIARGYECLVGYAGGNTYCGIAKWLGSANTIYDFEDITASANQVGTISNGDVIRASISDSGGVATIVMTKNGSQICTGVDRNSPYLTGNPGIGFFRRATGTNTEYGFNSFAVA